MSSMTPRIGRPRAVTADEGNALNTLHAAVGWPGRSLAGWRWMAASPVNAARQAPLGWVLDGPDGQPAAFIGNFLQQIVGTEGPVLACTGYSLIVAAAARGRAGALIRTLLRQQDVAVGFTLNANPLAAPLYPRLGFAPAPGPAHALKLSWTVDMRTAIAARACRWLGDQAPQLFADGREHLVSGRLARLDLPPLPPGVHSLEDISDEGDYARFWSALQAASPLISDRSPAVLRWRLANPDMPRPPVLIGMRTGGDLIATAYAVMSKQRTIDPPVLEIVDLQVLPDAAARALPPLMQALHAVARHQGASKLRLPVVSAPLLAGLGPWADRARREGGWGHGFMRWTDPSDPRARLWAPTACDGDYSFCLRPPPAPPPASGPAPSPACARPTA